MKALAMRVLSAALLALLTVSPAAAQEIVEGTIQYDAESVPMRHVYARETRPSPTSTEQPQIVILIADRPAPPEVANSRAAYYTAARLGQIRGLLLTLRPPSSEARMAIFAPGGAMDDRDVPNPFTRLELTELVREGGWVAGRLRMPEPSEFLRDADSPATPTTYAIDVRFRVPIAAAPRPTETLTGEAARRSPQAAAALRSLQLIRNGTPAQIRAGLHPNHPVWEGLSGGRAEAIIAMAREMLPAPTTFLQSIERLIVYGDEAVIVSRDSEGTTTVSLRQDGGEWKLAAASIPND